MTYCHGGGSGVTTDMTLCEARRASPMRLAQSFTLQSLVGLSHVTSKMATSKCAVICRLTFASIGVFVGLMAGPMFCMEFKNYDAGAFAFFSSIPALITLIVHVKWYRGLQSFFSVCTLTRLMYSGCIFQLIGVCSFVTYLVLGVLGYNGVLPWPGGPGGFSVHGPNYFITIVWNFMTWKWGFALFYYSRKYRSEISCDGGRTAIINDDEPRKSSS